MAPEINDPNTNLPLTEQETNAAVTLLDKHKEKLSVASIETLLDKQKSIIKQLPMLLQDLQKKLENAVKTVENSQTVEQRQVEIMADLDLAKKVMAKLGHGDPAAEAAAKEAATNKTAGVTIGTSGK